MFIAFLVTLVLVFACVVGSFAGSGIGSLAWNGIITPCTDCAGRIVEVSDRAASRYCRMAIMLVVLDIALFLIMAL